MLAISIFNLDVSTFHGQLLLGRRYITQQQSWHHKLLSDSTNVDTEATVQHKESSSDPNLSDDATPRNTTMESKEKGDDDCPKPREDGIIELKDDDVYDKLPYSYPTWKNGQFYLLFSSHKSR